MNFIVTIFFISPQKLFGLNQNPLGLSCPSSPAYNFPAESWKCLFSDLAVNALLVSKMTCATFLFFASKAFIWYVSSECLSPLPGGYVVTSLDF